MDGQTGREEAGEGIASHAWLKRRTDGQTDRRADCGKRRTDDMTRHDTAAWVGEQSRAQPDTQGRRVDLAVLKKKRKRRMRETGWKHAGRRRMMTVLPGFCAQRPLSWYCLAAAVAWGSLFYWRGRLLAALDDAPVVVSWDELGGRSAGLMAWATSSSSPWSSCSSLLGLLCRLSVLSGPCYERRRFQGESASPLSPSFVL